MASPYFSYPNQNKKDYDFKLSIIRNHYPEYGSSDPASIDAMYNKTLELEKTHRINKNENFGQFTSKYSVPDSAAIKKELQKSIVKQKDSRSDQLPPPPPTEDKKLKKEEKIDPVKKNKNTYAQDYKYANKLLNKDNVDITALYNNGKGAFDINNPAVAAVLADRAARMDKEYNAKYPGNTSNNNNNGMTLASNNGITPYQNLDHTTPGPNAGLEYLQAVGKENIPVYSAPVDTTSDGFSGVDWSKHTPDDAYYKNGDYTQKFIHTPEQITQAMSKMEYDPKKGFIKPTSVSSDLDANNNPRMTTNYEQMGADDIRKLSLWDAAKVGGLAGLYDKVGNYFTHQTDADKAAHAAVINQITNGNN